MTPPRARAAPGLAPRWLAARSLLALWPLVLREWRHHPWRHAVVALAVALGVALAWSVHLINASALSEFSAAVRSANGEPDLVLRGPREGFDDALLDTVATLPGVEVASPAVEFETYARSGSANDRLPVRVIGLDALSAAAITPAALPRPADDGGPLALLDPDQVFVNARARERMGLRDGDTLWLQAGPAQHPLRVGGSVAAGGTPLLVIDIAAAQAHFGHAGRLTRIDLRLAPGTDLERLKSSLPPGLRAAAAGETEQRVSNLSRAYRVNLTVLALVALFVGAFLVYSVVALSVAQRSAALALLGVLGMTAGERRSLVLAECAALGAIGSAAGLALGAALAALALRWLAGDLGGGYFPGIAASLQLPPAAAGAFGALGVASALLGGWVPARRAEQLQPALALKGLGSPLSSVPRAGPAWAALLAAGVLALAPPVAGLPVAAYASVALLLVGGVALVPWAVHLMLESTPSPRGALALLALRRARFQRHTATAAVSGVVASLALSVALTVMVGSFREGVSRWLDQVLPADLYARTAATSALAEQSWLPADFAARAAAVPGVRRVEAARLRPLQMAEGRPPVTLIARDLQDPASALPLLGPALPASSNVNGPASAMREPLAGPGAPPGPPGLPSLPRPDQPQQAEAPVEADVFVSEAVVSLYGAAPGQRMELPLDGRAVPVRVRGVWRDYARQFGAIAMASADYQRITGDTRINDLALWLHDGSSQEPAQQMQQMQQMQQVQQVQQVQQALRELAADAASAQTVEASAQVATGSAVLEFAATQELRRISLAIFDRSFAVTHYLQAVAIAIGLVGVAASLSAQVLARRREFGLLAHLGLKRSQVTAVVAGETLAWLAAGALVGLLLGGAISAVLVHVVNPQSFHWTMDLVWPWARLLALCAAVIAAGLATAALSARQAAGAQAVLSVKEDW